MRDIFVVSDTHFGHTNILKFEDENGKKFRGDLFADTEAMNEFMIEEWNEMVSPNDIVYHLGDVYFGPQADAAKILPRLNGSKRLIMGNHDDGKDSVLHKNFQKITMWRHFTEFDCLLTHVPVHESTLYKVGYNVHGHIHQNKAPTTRHINVSVEQIAYRPQHLETMMKDYKEFISSTFE